MADVLVKEQILDEEVDRVWDVADKAVVGDLYEEVSEDYETSIEEGREVDHFKLRGRRVYIFSCIA